MQRTKAKPRLGRSSGKGVRYSSYLAPTLALNQQYSSLLAQLVHITYPFRDQPPKSYYYDLLSLLRDIRVCLRKQLTCYQAWTNTPLQAFLQNIGLDNTGNLIGRLEEISNLQVRVENETELCEEGLDGMEVAEFQEEEEEEEELREKLGRLTKRRGQLQGRQEIIQQRVQASEVQARSYKKLLLSQQMRLRSLE